MNFLDFIILAALAYAAWKGFKKGFILELFTFLALFLGLYAGIHFSDLISKGLTSKLGLDSEYVPAISFTIVFLAVGAMIYFGGKALEKVIKVVQLNLLNKLLGIFFSVLKMIFIIGALFLLLESYNQKGKLLSQDTRDGSLFFNGMKKVVLVCIPAFESSTIYMEDILIEGFEGEDVQDESI